MSTTLVLNPSSTKFRVPDFKRRLPRGGSNASPKEMRRVCNLAQRECADIISELPKWMREAIKLANRPRQVYSALWAVYNHEILNLRKQLFINGTMQEWIRTFTEHEQNVILMKVSFDDNHRPDWTREERELIVALLERVRDNERDLDGGFQKVDPNKGRFN